VKTTLLLTLAALGSLAALSAQELKFDAKPGLWETTVTIEMSGLPAMPTMPQLTPEQLAQMPPEARARLQAMMAARGGSPRTSTNKSCVTKEMIDKGMGFGNDNNNAANCTRKVVTNTSSQVALHIECTPEKQDMKVVGDIKVERLDAEHVKYSGTTTMSGAPGSSTAGRNVETKINGTSKWLSSDCGDVKPADK